MCRSKADGGRRCHGRTATAHTRTTSEAADILRRMAHDRGETTNC